MKRILMIVIVLVGVAAAYAVIRPSSGAAPATAVDTAAVLAELSTVLHKMDSVTVITIEGTLTAKDLGDSTRNMETTFCYSRQGNQAYYRIGEQEMISLRDAYIVVAHDVKKIFLGAPREIVRSAQLPLAKEVSLMADEGYDVSRRVDDNGVHISLLNRIHPTCRAYDITYDSTGWIRETLMRMADDTDPVDTTRDKFIGVNIRKCEPGVARKDLLDKDRYTRLKGYELINER
jgi:hypothetical protein